MLKLKIAHMVTKALHAAPKTWHSPINKQIKYFLKVWIKKTRSYLVNTILEKIEIVRFQLILEIVYKKAYNHHFYSAFCWRLWPVQKARKRDKCYKC